LALASDALGYLPQLPLLWWLTARKELTVAIALEVIALTSLIAVLVSLFWFEKIRFDRQVIRTVAIRHWRFSRWLAPSAALQWASLNAFMISAPVYYGPAAAGALRACQNIVGVAHIWFLGLENVLPVETARRLHEDGLNELFRYLRQMLLRWGLVTGGFMLVIALAPSFWLHVVYGAHYTQFGYVLRLYGVLYMLVFIGGPLRAGLQAFECTAPILWSYIAMAVFAAIIAAPLAKLFGLFGVMLGLIATQLLFQVLLAAALIQRALRMRHQEALVLRT
jgi:O-antigen/teichoic acid export membrane protein